jgi:hypothetical protein
MPASALGEVLVTLADAQELSEQLPPLSRDHETVALVVASMKSLHRGLVGTKGRAELVINHSLATVYQAREQLAEVREQQCARRCR